MSIPISFSKPTIPGLPSARDLEVQLEKGLPGTKAQFIDLTGTQDHWQVIAVSESFEGLSIMACHRMVQKVFEADIQSGRVHALTIKTMTPAQAETQGKRN